MKEPDGSLDQAVLDSVRSFKKKSSGAQHGSRLKDLGIFGEETSLLFFDIEERLKQKGLLLPEDADECDEQEWVVMQLIRRVEERLHAVLAHAQERGPEAA